MSNNGHVSGIRALAGKTPAEVAHTTDVSAQSGSSVQKRGEPENALKRPDRRIARTQRLLHEALLQLILERGWDAVSVQDVCERADVGRSTFYVHFADKEELLISGFDGVRQTLRERAAERAPQPLGFTLGLLEHARENQKLFRALLGKRTAQVVHRAFVATVGDLVAADVAAVTPPGPLREASVRYLAGAFWELLLWWGEQPHASPVEVDEVFRRLTVAVLGELKVWT